ncbi:hypothetical protein L2K20_16135 [Mycobacterium sp. MBM]|nr:hypothetical protein [Mycobacterium sp. MBM]
MARPIVRAARFALGAGCLVVLTAGCGSPTIVNTGEPWTPLQTPSSTAGLPEHRTNAHLADASEYYLSAATPKVYRFATPSGRWQCEIVPHASAACRPTASSQLSIAGAPTSVPGADGESATPNTILIDRTSDVRFVANPAVQDATAGTDPPIATLPFGTVLQVAGFRCNVQELTGVSCGSESSGRGFTFAADGYTPVYTDVGE